MKIERWINDHDCTEVYSCSHDRKKYFRPDGYFRLLAKGRIYSFFIELDQSTMSNQRIKAKAKGYLEFALSGTYEKVFGVKYFRVLVIAPSQKRVANLKKTVEEVTDKIFSFTTLDQVASPSVFEMIWQRAGQEGLFSLIDS